MGISVSVNRSNSDAAITRCAPLGVVFDATATTDATTSNPQHDLLFYWNFGDSSAGTFTYGRPYLDPISKNIAFGPVAAHVYETPGTYTPVLGVYNGDSWGWATLNSITVTDPDAQFLGTDNIYISDSSANVPGGATYVNSLDWDADVVPSIATGKRIWLERGKTYVNSTAAAALSSAVSGCMVSAFGSGNKPIVSSGVVGSMLRFANATMYLTICDLKWTSSSGNRIPMSTAGGGIGMAGVTLHQNDFDTVLNTCSTSGSGATTDWLIDFIMHKCVGTVCGTTYMLLRRFGILDSSLTDSTNSEHTLRIQLGQIGAVQGSTFSTAASGKTVFALRGVPFDGSGDATPFGAGQYTEKVVCSDLKIQMGADNLQAVEIAPRADSEDERQRDIIMERCHLLGATGTTTPQQMLKLRTGPTGPNSFRSNILDMTAHALERHGFFVFPPDDVHGINTSNVWILGNSYIQRPPGTAGASCRVVFLHKPATQTVTNCVVKNNLARCEDIAAVTEAIVTDQGTSNTTTPNWTDVTGTSPYTDSTPTNPELGDFTPTGSALTDGDATVKNYVDFFGRLRGDLAEMGAVALTTDVFPAFARGSLTGLG